MLMAKITNKFDTVYSPVNKVYAYEKTDYGLLGIYDLVTHGKTIILNDELQSCARDYYLYHAALVLPHTAKKNEKALVLGAGEGVSVDMVVGCDYHHIDAVDIDPRAIELYKMFLSDWNNGIYDEGRSTDFNMHYSCAYEFLKKQEDESYEYIVYDLDTDGATKLIDKCMPEMHRVLKTTGVLSVQDGHRGMPSISKEAASKCFDKKPSEKVAFDWKFCHYVK